MNLSPSELQIIDILGQASPNELFMQDIVKSSGGGLDLGSIKAKLAKLEGAGLVVSRRQFPGSELSPRFYKATAAGTQACAASR